MNNNLKQEALSQQQIQRMHELVDRLRISPKSLNTALSDIFDVIKSLEQGSDSLNEMISNYSERLKNLTDQRLKQITISLNELSSIYSESLKISAEQMNTSILEICKLYNSIQKMDLNDSLEMINHIYDNLVHQCEAFESVPIEAENKKSNSDKEKLTFDKVVSMIITIYGLINILCTILGTTPLEVRNDIFEFIEHLIKMNNEVCIQYELPEYSITENINQLLHQEEYKETQESF